ncbi:uncharacterized protein LOC142578891 [Dermacentor variabilis]|uniref:uncharacterized protein LOC142578891 n=1 Tax=Dermacentor variabilis TaxID=34621 RepID=UPI003F5AF895
MNQRPHYLFAVMTPAVEMLQCKQQADGEGQTRLSSSPTARFGASECWIASGFEQSKVTREPSSSRPVPNSKGLHFAPMAYASLWLPPFRDVYHRPASDTDTSSLADSPKDDLRCRKYCNVLSYTRPVQTLL